MNKIKQVLFFSMLLFVGIFCFNASDVLAANSGDVVINELMWMGSSASSKDEWIELKNMTSQDIDLSGWTIEGAASAGGTLVIPDDDSEHILPANGFYLISYYSIADRILDPKTTVINVIVDWRVKNMGNISLANEYDNNGVLILKDRDGNLMEMDQTPKLDSKKPKEWPAGEYESKEIYRSMERNDIPGDGTQNDNWHTCSQAVNLIEGAIECGTPRFQNSDGQNGGNNSASEISKQEAANSAGVKESVSGNKGDVPGSVVINELVSDPEDGPEWIELYNKTNNEIDLSGWRVEEGSEAKTVLDGKISKHGYLVIENLKGNLNNSGDIIFLFDDVENVIDQVVYGNWDDGNINDNAPKSSDPNGIGRIGASQDTNNDLADFQVVSVLTPNAANILINEQLGSFEESVLKNKIIINEIFPNPKGSDDGEFIELKNIGVEEIDLSGLSLGDNSNSRYKIKDGVKIQAGKFVVIPRSESKIALNNTGGDKVFLYDEKENIIDAAEYLEKALEDKSYILFERIWGWTDQPSAGVANILIKENQPPVAVIDLDKSDVLVGEELALDCSDSYDPEGENLILEWQVNDLLYHDLILKLKFDHAGSYQIKLTLSDGEKKTITTRLVNVLGRAGSAMSPNLPKSGSGSLASTMEAKLPLPPLINEFLPNPKGSDDGEFIELFNPNDVEINLKNFYLDDGDGGSSPYQIKDDVILKPFGYFVFERATTKLALNNTGDAVRLLSENKNVLEQINYSDVLEGLSFSRALSGNWFWTKAVTRGVENQFEFISEDGSVLGGQDEAGLFGAIDLSDVRGMEFGEKIKTRGIVTVLPGVFGSQVFYIDKALVEIANQNSNVEIGLATNGMLNPLPTPPREGSLLNPPTITPAEWGNSENPPSPHLRKGGIQIYSYRKNFPELKIGDEVEVVGILSQSGGEHRLKISQKEDIKILWNTGDIEPVKITVEEIGKELEGSFVLVEGEIIEINGSSIFIDDGSGETKVYLKESSGVKKTDLKEGDVVSAAGIISQTSSGFRLLPRFQDDIKKIKTLGAELAADAVGENSSDIKIEPRGVEWLKYITAGLGAIVLILAAVNFRMRKNRKSN